MTHYIGMNGTYGCMPDNCFSAETRRGAIDSLKFTLDLGQREVTELRRDGIVKLDDCWHDRRGEGHGADYASVDSCACATPGVHNDGGAFDDD